MKDIGIWGDCNSIWVKTYIREVLDYIPDGRIVVFSERSPKADISEYYSKNIKIYDCSGPDFLNRIKLGFLVYFYKVFLAILKEGRFDFFHIQYVTKRKLVAAKCLQNG